MIGRYTVVVKDKQGKVVSRTRGKMRSYVRQMIDLLSLLADATDTAVTDITNTSRTVKASVAGLNLSGPAGNDDYGVVVGTGMTAVTISDYALGTLIVEGTGSGQIQYQANSIGAATVDGSDCYYKITRSAINNSGATITVKEIGLYAYCTDTGLISRYFLIVRDVLTTTQAVPDGGSITVEYTLKVTV